MRRFVLVCAALATAVSLAADARRLVVAAMAGTVSATTVRVTAVTAVTAVGAGAARCGAAFVSVAGVGACSGWAGWSWDPEEDDCSAPVTSSTTVPTESTVWPTPVVTFETASVSPVSGPPLAEAGPASTRLKIAAIDATTARL